MKNLFIVESPLQLLNAFEALNTFAVNTNVILIRLSGDLINDKQIKETEIKLHIFDFAKVNYILINKEKRNIFDLLKMILFKIYFLFFVSTFDKVFIGNYESKFIRFIIPFSKKIILLDDGFKTINIQNKFTSTNSYDWFTIFDLPLIEGQKQYINKYTYLNNQIISKLNKNNKNDILFIGMKLSEVGIISEEYYLQLLNRISLKYYNRNILYVAHRGESNKKLRMIGINKNIKILQLDYPIELLFIYFNEIPKIIISFFSTALITLHKIYKVETIAYKFDYSKSFNFKDIEQVYNYCSKYINVIEEKLI